MTESSPRSRENFTPTSHEWTGADVFALGADDRGDIAPHAERFLLFGSRPTLAHSVLAHSVLQLPGEYCRVGYRLGAAAVLSLPPPSSNPRSPRPQSTHHPTASFNSRSNRIDRAEPHSDVGRHGYCVSREAAFTRCRRRRHSDSPVVRRRFLLIQPHLAQAAEDRSARHQAFSLGVDQSRRRRARSRRLEPPRRERNRTAAKQSQLGPQGVRSRRPRRWRRPALHRG